ncbi:discoidin domain-containing receptor 2 isoform X2 [Nerophis ophidion]|uniref:discoidin domain-containing receptor 2 isoform X2 n=1 Tax=Nerophis ophidion TaxID=159077 RepID=UPI002ADFF055|nr:discoidin domain-containing receptor 2 isoform X2 [Nerophis ophidion]XP_061745654.1 discoidin domain-containing receptor 2 isoform X2 [Nerophis ophidion]XP_061745735.1 discoidin domain-containing receptor 2 isoform X2 [Nerophis ophidion]XP_061745824.1 discoidin domain-containing receptor 2 isoform X2 [Nerophis ophidion]XP_061745912.1 discoidin domain-containing receptor 2 isoform X2 [Nerophis ophidion]XP_061746001.1 discoidin domain-containing receptor 2 isoform X2 [Nerophis ophidion]XP_06
MHLLLLLLLMTLHPPTASAQIDPAHCRYALGMEDGRIKDDDITASSQWHETTGPQYARLNREEGDGAWCPEGQQEATDSQFLQVDLRRLTFLTVVATQGRYARNGIEFAHAYSLNYSRDGVTWKSWTDRLGTTVMEGNKNAYEPVINDLHPPVVTRWVRLIPLTELSTVCMRAELYGCPWEDGLISYSAPEGQLMAPPGSPVASLNDSTYDGVHEKRKLYGGLGQLTDGVTGLDDFLMTRQYHVWPGYDYLGWKNQSLGGGGHVEMEFVFDRQRNFTSMKVHSNNMFARGVKIFSSVSCWFKPRLLANWEAEPVVFNTVLDDRNPSARYVTVPLERRTAVSLRCRFYFADLWMMFSEISFQSEDFILAATPPSASDHSTVTATPAANPSASDAPDDGKTPVLIGCLVTIILLLVIIIFLILWCQYVCKVLEKAPRRILGEEVRVRLSSCSDTIILQTPPVPPRSGHAPADPAQTDPHYERVFLLDPQYQNPVALRNKLPELSQSAEASACGGGYAEPDITQCTPHQCFHSNAPHYAETDIVRLQGVTGSNMYAVPALTVDSLTRKDISASEFPRQQLIFREKLGEGQFGEVHLCEAEGLAEFLGEGSPLPDRDGRAVLVAVKQLRADATNQARNDFLKEIKIMSRLNDPNIIRLLCVCVTSDPLCMVTEYMENGDLNMFLSQREMESTLTHANNIPSVSLSDLLHMSVQISSGMKYLASLNFVHRDLATRNCLLDRRLTMKISDFGMSRNLYSSDYYRIQGRAVLPIRWMAWESILLGKFTTASDVWAFGVTLWEIFTLCKEQPYSLLTDEQVIANTGEFFRNQGRQVFLYAPPLCPPSLFELMMRCWRRDIPDRPTFEGLYQALKPHVSQSVPTSPR